MEFVLVTPKILILIGVGLVILGILTFTGVLRGRRHPLNYKVGGVIVIVMGIFLITVKNVGKISVSEEQIALKTILMKSRVIKVNEIQRIWIENLTESKWYPAKKRSGTAIGDLRTGWFTLRNGRKAYLILRGDRALCIEVDQDNLYLLGVPEFNDFISQIKADVPRLNAMLND